MRGFRGFLTLHGEKVGLDIIRRSPEGFRPKINKISGKKCLRMESKNQMEYSCLLYKKRGI